MGSQFLYPRLAHLSTLPVSFSASGDNTVISADAVKRICVHRLWLVVAGATNLTFKDGASNSLSGAVPMASNGGITFDLTGEPWFVTALTNAFIINNSNAVQVSGQIYYTLTL